MSLTKPRAHQLFDLDYKQAVRAITDENISLTGGAPAVVDGVALTAKDRVLVAGQNNASENGLYQVVTLGSGSNGTWIRSQDADANGELLAGAIVMVTEGTVYADTQWKLVSDNPIIIGNTPLTWEQNSAFAFGNIVANGTPVLANTVGDTVAFVAGDNISIVGNAAAKSVTIGVTGISLNSINNGTSNVNITTANGNVTTAVNGSTILTITDSGANVNGYATVTGNVTGGNIVTTGQLTATGNIFGGNIISTGATSTETLTVVGNANIGNVNTSGSITAVGNITAPFFIGNTVGNVTGDLTGNVLGDLTGNVTGDLTGNVTGDLTGNVTGNVLGDVTGDLTGNVTGDLTGNVTGNVLGDVTGDLTGNVTGNVLGDVTGDLTGNVTGNVTGDLTGNVTGNVTGDLTGNVTGNVTGNLTGNVLGDVTGNLTGDVTGDLTGNVLTNAQPNITSVGTLISLSVTGNVEAGNLISNGDIDVIGNVSGNFFLGNGSQLLGINAFSTISVAGQANVVANSISDTLTFVAGSGIAILTDAGNDVVTIATVGAGSAIFATGGDMGTVEEEVTSSTDLGLIIDSIIESYDLGTIVVGGLIYPDQFVLPSFTVAELGEISANPAGQMVFCTNDINGSIPAFSDGTDWRRVTDRQIVS
jgi:hypothetical protein